MYVIKNKEAEDYLRMDSVTKRYVVVHQAENAEKWGTMTKAHNVLKSQLSKQDAKFYEVVPDGLECAEEDLKNPSNNEVPNLLILSKEFKVNEFLNAEQRIHNELAESIQYYFDLRKYTNFEMEDYTHFLRNLNSPDDIYKLSEAEAKELLIRITNCEQKNTEARRMYDFLCKYKNMNLSSIEKGMPVEEYDKWKAEYKPRIVQDVMAELHKANITVDSSEPELESEESELCVDIKKLQLDSCSKTIRYAWLDNKHYFCLRDLLCAFGMSDNATRYMQRYGFNGIKLPGSRAGSMTWYITSDDTLKLSESSKTGVSMILVELDKKLKNETDKLGV